MNKKLTITIKGGTPSFDFIGNWSAHELNRCLHRSLKELRRHKLTLMKEDMKEQKNERAKSKSSK